MTDVAPSAGSPLHLEIPINAPLRGVIAQEKDFLDMIGEVSKDVTSQRTEPVRWLLAHARTNGVIQLRLLGVPARDDIPATVMPEIVSTIVTGMATVEMEARQPDHFNDRALELTQALAERTTETGGLRVVNGTLGTNITPEGTGANVRTLLGVQFSDYGSVEGTLLGVNAKTGDRYFTVYDELTNRSIRCYYARRIDTARIGEALERRVIATGLVNYRASGQINSVNVDALTVLPKDDDLPPFSEVRGILA